VAPVATLPTPSVTCFTGLPTPAGILSSPFPATPVTPLIVLFSPVVAVLVTEFTVPVVRPTPLFSAPVAALDAWPTTPGCFAAGAGAGDGAVFFTAAGVGFVASGLAVRMGNFLGAGFVVVVDGVDVAALAGVLAFTGVLAAGVDALEDGRGFLVPMGVRVGAGAFTGVFVGVFAVSLGVIFFAATGVFLTGVVFDVAGAAFFAAAGVLTGVVFCVVLVGEARGAAEFSFAGAFLIGVVADPVALVAAGVAFFTGAVVFWAVDVVVFAAVAGVFFAVEEAPWATFCKSPTPAVFESTPNSRMHGF